MTDCEPSLPIQRLVADIDVAVQRRRQRSTTRAWRVKLCLAVIGAVGTSAAVAAATGSLVLFEATSAYKVTEHADTPTGRVCLDLRLADPNRRGLVGCGRAPTAKQPFGMLVVDREPGDENIVFGLVKDDIASVRIAGRDVVTRRRAGLPGRFFSSKVSDSPTVYAEGLDSAGAVVAAIGSRTRSNTMIHSAEQARAQGDFSGFAPGAAEAPFTHNGSAISTEQVQKQHLVCTEDDTPTIPCSTP